MDGFTGFKTATAEELPEATAVMDSFHVVALAGEALDRQRGQQDIHGHRGRTGDPLYGIRRVLRTGAELLTDRQRVRPDAVFADERHRDQRFCRADTSRCPDRIEGDDDLFDHTGPEAGARPVRATTRVIPGWGRWAG